MEDELIQERLSMRRGLREQGIPSRMGRGFGMGPGYQGRGPGYGMRGWVNMMEPRGRGPGMMGPGHGYGPGPGCPDCPYLYGPGYGGYQYPYNGQ
ncbi:MAG: hypothetical protein ACOC0U_06765 [Desulfovibrionales bacterium]